MDESQLVYLDGVARDVLAGRWERVSGLSTGERLYVALAAGDVYALRGMGYTIPQALARLGGQDMLQLILRWQSVDQWAPGSDAVPRDRPR